MPRIIDIKQETELASVVDFLLESSCKLVLLYGDLGTGKTTLTKEFFKRLGVDEEQMSSPSFGLVNTYEDANGLELHHMDLYRIREPEEVFDFGLEMYLDSDAYVFIEWPEILDDFWSNMAHVKVQIEQLNTTQRRFIITEHDLA